jgi:hypothetical protein
LAATEKISDLGFIGDIQAFCYDLGFPIGKILESRSKERLFDTQKPLLI